jgi:ATP adenylyltransferase
MKTLWTPWRMERIIAVQAADNSGKEPCPFEPPGTAPDSKADLLLYRTADRLCLLNRFPYANGHLLVAPTRHVADLADLSSAERAGMMELVNSATAILKHVLDPDGFNIGINLGIDAGAGIPEHLHIHVVPRWRGDHNYLTVLAEIRTIPEHIEATFDRLLPYFRNLPVT